MYRTEWRNPSTHDYKLDFDESEALLAIVSVSAFACLLLDQIAERLAYVKSQADAERQKDTLIAQFSHSVNESLPDRVVELLDQFCRTQVPMVAAGNERPTESQLIGSLHGFLSFAAPELNVLAQPSLTASGRRFRPDLIVVRGDDRVVVEVKRSMMMGSVDGGVAQVERYMLAGGIKNGILLLLPETPGDMRRVESPVNSIDGKLVVLLPSS